MSKWICDGVPKDGQPHPEQSPTGPHIARENYGDACPECGLPKAAVEKAGVSAQFPIPLLATIGGVVLLLLGVGGYTLFAGKSCPTGQQKIGNVCVASTPVQSPPPTIPSTPVSTITPTPTNTNTPIGTPVGYYGTLAEVPVPKLNITYGGSTSFAPIRPRQEWYQSGGTPQRLDEYIMQVHPNFKLIYKEPPTGEKSGSGSGIRMLLDGQLSFGQSSRPLKEVERQDAKAKGFSLKEVPVALDGIAIYVNPQLTIPGLTRTQVQDIYTGKITNWSQVGGPNLPIQPYSRDPNDGGTPDFFKSEVLGDNVNFAPSVQPYVRDTTDSLRKVGQNLGGIGYATASEVCNQSTVKTLPLSSQGQNYQAPCDGSKVNQTVFLQGAYPITRQLFVIIKEDASVAQEAGQAYANLVLSNEGQKLLGESGLVPLRTP